MVKKLFLLFLLILVLFPFVVYLQEGGQINAKQQELNKIREEINALQNEINSRNKKEKESYKIIENYNKQNFLINKIISKIREEENLNQVMMERNVLESDLLDDEIVFLKENYARYVKSIYKYGHVSEIAYLFDGASVNKLLLRYKYLNFFSQKRKGDLDRLNAYQLKLVINKKELEEKLKEKEELLAKKLSEENVLQSKLNERKKVLNTIKKDKLALASELNAKKDAEKKIRNIISRLITETSNRRQKEKIKKEEEKQIVSNTGTNNKTTVNKIETETKRDYDVDLISSFSTFSNMKGRLGWPVGGRIIKKMGENKNPTLNTVTINYGVDILSSGDLNVKAVGDGIVSAIEFIPGYGSIIIITHKGDYRTVYSHLSKIFVNEGEQVKAGKVIAMVNEGLEGNILHFEIWSSRNFQDPEVWLAKR